MNSLTNLILGLLFITLVKSSPFHDCGSAKGKVTAVDVGGCTANPCVLKKHTNATIKISFTPHESVTKLTAVVHGVIAGVHVKFPLSDPDCCVAHGLSCPLTANQPAVFNTVLPIKSIYPSLKVVVQWEMQDQDGVDVVCIAIPAEIES